tara:strand:+ start:1424 stop:1675 length:252 start_codon:yes stop_codon:yes gene_type:complete
MKDESIICTSCEDDINMRHEFHAALHSLVTLSHKAFDSPAEAITVGLSYFMEMNFACAPNQETAKELALDIIKFYEEKENANH